MKMECIGEGNRVTEEEEEEEEGEKGKMTIRRR